MQTAIGTAGLVVGGIGNLESILSPAHAQSRRITFEEARANTKLRQKYIDQLAREEFGDDASTFVDRFVYDHDTSIARNYEAQTRFESAETKIIDKLMQELLPKVLTNPKLRGVDKSIIRDQLEARIREEFRSTPEYSRLKEIVYAESINSEDFKKGKMVTLLTSYQLEKKPKSRIFVFRQVFEDTDAIFDRYPATEEGVKSALRHEYRHAKQTIMGIKLSNGVHLSPEYLSKLNRKVRGFAGEVEAYIQEVDNTLKLGTDHPAYRESVAVLKQYIHQTLVHPATFIDPRKYSTEDKKVIDYVKSEIRNAGKRHPTITEELKFEIRLK